MEEREHVPIEQMDLFLQFVSVSNWVWNAVAQWPPLARDTVGKQLIRACDSIGANLVEGDGRYTTADSLHFFIVARASAREARYWLERAVERQLLSEHDATGKLDEIINATRLLNRLITYRRSRVDNKRVREPLADYEVLPAAHDAPGFAP